MVRPSRNPNEQAELLEERRQGQFRGNEHVDVDVSCGTRCGVVTERDRAPDRVGDSVGDLARQVGGVRDLRHGGARGAGGWRTSNRGRALQCDALRPSGWLARIAAAARQTATTDSACSSTVRPRQRGAGASFGSARLATIRRESNRSRKGATTPALCASPDNNPPSPIQGMARRARSTAMSPPGEPFMSCRKPSIALIAFWLAVSPASAFAFRTSPRQHPPPTISAITPACAAHGEEVQITGTRFRKRKLEVSVGGTPASILSASNRQARFLVPAGAPSGDTTVALRNADSEPATIGFRVGCRADRRAPARRAGGARSASAHGGAAYARRAGDVVDGLILTRLIVYLAPGATVGEVNAALESVGARIVTMAPGVPSVTVAIPRQPDKAAAEALATSLAGQPGILHVILAYEARTERRAGRRRRKLARSSEGGSLPGRLEREQPGNRSVREPASTGHRRRIPIDSLLETASRARSPTTARRSRARRRRPTATM